jgi:pyruvate dehydrogenase E2 component (dihydrolipoamide acetyltransferase)
MAISVVMPALEMAQETGRVLAWRKQEGEHVTKGEPLLEIETDKAVVEVEAPGDGLLASVAAKVGEEIPVGRTIAWLVRPGEQPPAGEESNIQSGRAKSTNVWSEANGTLPASTEATAAPQILPKARRLAKELGVSFKGIRGTGPDGIITVDDVQAFAHASKAGPSLPLKAESLSTVARLMAERTTQSWTQVPHFFVSREVICTALGKAQVDLAGEIARAHGVQLTITDFLVILVARVLTKHPRVNATWKDGTIQDNTDINISVAMAVEGGVINGVIHNPHSLHLLEVCKKRRELTELARAGRLRPADIQGGTFSISNLGMYKVDAFTAIIPPGQSAILAVSAIVDRVVAVDAEPQVRPMMNLTLSGDHRVIDGVHAALFLQELANAIAAPDKWLD